MDMKKVVITGGTGMVGKGVLYECLDDPNIEEVLCLGRSPLGMTHPKLKECLSKDLMNTSTYAEALKGYDACFFCLGISSFRMNEEDYAKITYDLTMAIAKEFLAQNPGSTFIYVSGDGTDSSEKGKVMWARVKGKTENDLLKMGFGNAYMFRPAGIYPERGIKSKTPLYNTFMPLLKLLYPLLKALFPKYLTTTGRIGRAMIYLVGRNYDKQVLHTKEIEELDRLSKK